MNKNIMRLTRYSVFFLSDITDKNPDKTNCPKRNRRESKVSLCSLGYSFLYHWNTKTSFRCPIRLSTKTSHETRPVFIIISDKVLLKVSCLYKPFESPDKMQVLSWVWWHMPVIPVVTKLKKEGCKSEESLSYTVRNRKGSIQALSH